MGPIKPSSKPHQLAKVVKKQKKKARSILKKSAAHDDAMARTERSLRSGGKGTVEAAKKYAKRRMDATRKRNAAKRLK